MRVSIELTDEEWKVMEGRDEHTSAPLTVPLGDIALTNGLLIEERAGLYVDPIGTGPAQRAGIKTPAITLWLARKPASAEETETTGREDKG